MADKKDKKKGKDAHAAPPADGVATEGAEGAVEVAPAKKGPPIKLILMIVVPLLLIGGVVGGLFAAGILGGAKEATAEEGDASAEGDHAAEGEHSKTDKKEKKEAKKDKKEEHGKEAKADKKDGGHGGDEHGKEGEAAGPVYFDMQDILVNLDARQGRKATLLKLGITLEIDSAEDKKTLEGLLPKIMDQFQTFLRELRVEDLKGSAGIYRLRQELLARIRPAVEPVEVKDVLFREFLIQ